MSSKILIVAPHIDDEAIGCWSVLNRKNVEITVQYMREITANRKQEGEAAAAFFGFTPRFGGGLPSVHNGEFDEIYVPSRRDWHADHKQINMHTRQWATHFYSVDMANGKPLQPGNMQRKRECLNALYPSQRKLWETDDKYWLFEDIQTTDYDVYTKLAWTQPNGHTLTVVVNKVHETLIAQNWYPFVKLDADGIRKEDIDRLLGWCRGRVTIEYMNTIVEAL